MDINELIKKTVEDEVRKALDTFVIPAAREAAIAAAHEATTAATDALRSGLTRALDELVDQSNRLERERTPGQPMSPPIPPAEGVKAAPAHLAARAGRVASVGKKDDKHLTIQQAAKAVKLTPKSIYHAISTGKLKTTKIPKPPNMKRGPRDGMLMVVSLEDLRAWRASQN